MDQEERNRTPAVALTATTSNDKNSTPAASSTAVEGDKTYDDDVGPSAMANAVVAVVAPLPAAVDVDEENSNSNLSEPAVVNLATEPSYQEVNESTPPEERPLQPHGGGGAGDANPNLKAKPDTKVKKSYRNLLVGV